MSRKASIGGRAAGSSAINAEDQCPICKTSRYINKDLEFLINPECYHPMCTSCVNRLFNEAPAQCPTAGCNKTLRRKGFRGAFFGDLAVEREVDIRRRVAAVFNRGEDDFETADDYNAYLNQVEDLTADLVWGVDEKRRAAEDVLARHEVENRAQIERSRRLGNEASEAARRRIEAELDAKRQRNLQALREAQDEKAARARVREEQLDELAEAPLGAAAVVLRKRTKAGAPGGAGGAENKTSGAAADWSTDVGKLSIRGLKDKKKKKPAAQGPYDPFGGLNLAPSRYGLHEDLVNPWKNSTNLPSTILTGGYSFEEHTARAMFEAFAGLGVFVEHEKGPASLEGGEVRVKEENHSDRMEGITTPAIKTEAV